MMFSGVGHVGVHVTDLEASVVYATTVLGMRGVARDDGRVFLTSGSAYHCLEYVQGETTALDHVALQARSREALEQARERLVTAGHDVAEAPAEPGIVDSFRFVAPGGHRFDLYAPATKLPPHMPAGRPPYRATGVGPARLGHANLNTKGLDALVGLFTDVLDFRISDIVVDDADAPAIVFLRCGTDHHSVALSVGQEGMFHVAFQVEAMHDLARLGDAIDVAGTRFIWGPGRHGAGNNVATYHQDPSKVPLEFFWDIMRIDDDGWEPRRWTFADYRLFNTWGPVVGDVEELLAIAIPVAR